MNYEAYTLSKNANAHYTLVNALTGLVITGSSLDDKANCGYTVIVWI